MKYKSQRVILAAVLLLALCYGTGGITAVHAEEAEITAQSTEENQKEPRDSVEESGPQQYTVPLQAEGRSSGVGTADITATEGRKLDGIYYTGFTINGRTGYCLQSSMDTPEDAVYEVEKELAGEDSFLSKAMYYAYGNPGYRPELWVPDCPGDTERAYLRAHLVLSSIYDAGSTLDREVKDPSWIPWWKEYISGAIARLQEEPGVPEAGLVFSSEEEQAYFDRESGAQRTDPIRLLGDARNKITLPLPEGIILVNESRNTEEEGTGILSGGDSFYLKTGAEIQNGGTYDSGELAGSITENWATLLIQTGAGRQDMGMGIVYAAQESPVRLSVKWIPAPELHITKEADRESRLYKKGELITYTLEITQLVPEAAAVQLVIEDCILTEGVRLQKETVKVMDAGKEEITDTQITVNGNQLLIEGGQSLEFLECVETGQRIYVEYQALVLSDEMEVVENTAKARSTNTPEVTVKEKVKIETPVVPLITTTKTRTVQTGDSSNLTLFFLFLFLSCAAIVKCARIAHRKHK